MKQICSNVMKSCTSIFVLFFSKHSMKMEVLMLRFPHLPEQILQKLDDESIFKSREVARPWQNLIDGRNYTWLRIVNIPSILQDGNKYLHLAAETGRIEEFKLAFSEEQDKNIINDYGETSFHLACKNGHLKIVQLLLKNTYSEFGSNTKDLDLNAKNYIRETAFTLACKKGHSEVVKLLIENSAAFSIDLNAKDWYGKTAFMSASIHGHSDIFKILMKNAAASSIDLRMDYKQYKYLILAFHVACLRGHLDMVKFFQESAASFGIDLNMEDNNVMKAKEIEISLMNAFDLACFNGLADVIKIFTENAVVGALYKQEWHKWQEESNARFVE